MKTTCLNYSREILMRKPWTGIVSGPIFLDTRAGLDKLTLHGYILPDTLLYRCGSGLGPLPVF
jgi:hypothetical protein